MTSAGTLIEPVLAGLSYLNSSIDGDSGKGLLHPLFLWTGWIAVRTQLFLEQRGGGYGTPRWETPSDATPIPLTCRTSGSLRRAPLSPVAPISNSPKPEQDLIYQLRRWGFPWLLRKAWDWCSSQHALAQRVQNRRTVCTYANP